MGRAVLLALLALALPAGAQGWPFGEGSGPFARKDLYNLGLLGAKASDADRERPDGNMPPRGGRRVVEVEPESGDDGPERLRIELLFPGGPAEQAGLQAGDVLIGINNAKFSKGSLAPLAKALLKAEAGRGAVTLVVKRAGKTVKVKATIPTGGSHAAKPTKGKGRRALVDKALAWLAERQLADSGGYKETLSGLNGAVIQTALAGLAWLGGGSDLKNGPYRDNVRKAADFVVKHARTLDDSLVPREPGGPSWNQGNWGWAHAAIFLGELHARTPDRGVLDALHFCARRLVETQEASGGWAHGPGGKNALDYLELNIVTGLALCGLGLAQANGFEVPDETLKKAEKYLELSSGGGGVGYSAQPGQKGQGNIGRTAGCWLGYLALGRAKSAWGKKMASFVRREAGNVLGGHASLMQHIQLAGIAAHAMGGAARKKFWEGARRDLVLARAPDGSFQPRPWHETVSMSSNSDVTFGEVWTTASWTLVLVSEPDRNGVVGFPAWFHKR